MDDINRFSGEDLYERAKELKSIYMVNEVLQNKKLTLPAAMGELVSRIPEGFAVPSACRVKITIGGDEYQAQDFAEAKVLYTAPLVSLDKKVGEIAVGYIEKQAGEPCALLSEEIKLIDTLASRIAAFAVENQRELILLLDMLSDIDPDMLIKICEKLRVHLKQIIGEGADKYFDDMGITEKTYGEINAPIAKPFSINADELREKLIAAATAFLPQGEVSKLLKQWILEQRALTLVKVIDNKDARISAILDALRKYADAAAAEKNSAMEKWLVAELTNRFITGDQSVVNLVVDSLKITDFVGVLERIIGSDTSKGNIGKKGGGLFIAHQILSEAARQDPLLADIKVPRTWYIATDQIVDFLHYNNLEELNSYKYNSAFYLRITYNNVVSKIKNSRLPPNTVQMLRLVLDEMDSVPIIVRSSSLLEDQQGSAFSGKYKSLFLTNRGTKAERLDALIDAVLEVYSSMYNPDAIQYRREKNLLNVAEQMGVLIQEVVGQQVGGYYLPAFAGVAFSHNSLRWSPRIKPEDGLVRMVMGLGTRAVDRINNDYPVLFSPEHPELRVNQTPADIRHYSPKYIDLINLRENKFQTVEAAQFLREEGANFDKLHNYVSVYSDDFIEDKNAFTLDTQKHEMVITFNKILTKTDIPQKICRILKVLSQKLQTPVDIEFASDGENLYLLQCRPQSGGIMSAPAPIPQNIAQSDILFTANRFICDGMVKNITHIVYVDGDEYNALSSLEELYAVGEAVGLLGDLLPGRHYILMGPGRWGSRGDLKLGVRVTYSDISSSAALIEIAKKKHSYTPELSFGTHFFQDLVEAGIVYVPIYPDEPETIFKDNLLLGCDNVLNKLLPKFSHLEKVIRVIDVPASFGGKTLSIHMNSELGKAVAFFTRPQSANNIDMTSRPKIWQTESRQEHSQWRYYMAQQIASSMDMEGLGVKGIYLHGSVNSQDAGMGSDIDLLIHVGKQNETQKIKLENWIDGWSRALAQINYLRTGYMVDKLLDVRIITDNDIKENTSYALKINSVVDYPATPLRVIK